MKYGAVLFTVSSPAGNTRIVGECHAYEPTCLRSRGYISSRDSRTITTKENCEYSTRLIVLVVKGRGATDSGS